MIKRGSKHQNYSVQNLDLSQKSDAQTEKKSLEGASEAGNF